MPSSHEITRLDVIEAVRAVAVNDEETHATIIHVNRYTYGLMMPVWRPTMNVSRRST